MKRILLIGYNYAPEPTGIGKYSGEMIAWLARHGYKCSVITAYPYYPFWKVQEPYGRQQFWYTTERQAFSEGGAISVHRCPMYVPAEPSGLKRILLDVSFSVAAFFKLIQLLFAPKYDYVITIVPSFQFGLLGILYKKLRHAKLLYHIHDMQIEAARDLQMIRSDKLLKTLFKVEKFIFNQCDTITCVGEGMVRRTRAKTAKDIALFPNWSDLDFFHPLEDRPALKKSLGFGATDKIILYSGGIGEKQGLESILAAAKALEQQRELKFLISGSGPYKEKLQNRAQSLGLNNVVFCALQPIDTFNMFLNMADLHLVIQKASACDLVMPSKLMTILSVGGLALVTANKGSGLYTVVDQHQMGLLVEAENQLALIEGIKKAFSKNHAEIKRNARSYAESFLAIDKIMNAFETSLLHNEPVHQIKIGTKPAALPGTRPAQNRLPRRRVDHDLATPWQNNKTTS